MLGLGGVAFGYFVVLPPAIHFLTSYDSAQYTILIRARDYYKFASFVLLGVGLAFEVPVFVLALVRLRILTAAKLRSTWRVGVFLMTVIGVLLPGVDPVSTLLSVIPLVLLYVLSIGLATFLEPRWRQMSYPKIELHVHLEGTVRPRRCSRSRRATTTRCRPTREEGLAELYEFRDFAHFIEVWMLTTNALRTAEDFRQVVVDYAAEAAAHGAVYLEGIFSPGERVRRGVGWDEIFSGVLRRRRRRPASCTGSRCA